LTAEYCVGVAQFGMKNYGVANKTGQPNQTEINKIVSVAVENGIRYFDTAQSYGNSEQVLGKAIRELVSSKSIRIISKLSPDLQESDVDTIYKSVASSIKRLGVNQLYGFLAHRPEALVVGNYSSAVQKLKDSGLLLKSGVSVYTPTEAKIAIEYSHVDMIQIPLNILDRRWIDEGIVELARNQKKQLMYRSIFLQGLIFLSEADLDKRNMLWAEPFLNEFKSRVAETGLTPIELSFNLLASTYNDGITIFGTEKLSQLEHNIKLLNNLKYDKQFAAEWWESLPCFPEKLLNPALWSQP
jgi:aryl-alcohol dehydrogenase-like predicted oxidoreductase